MAKKNVGTRVVMCLDSGAFSLYQKHCAGKPLSLQQQFYKSKEFKTYLEHYIASLHKYKDSLKMYVTLDVIRNPDATWELLQYMESCGLKPLPVFHARSDAKWLFKILDKYEYFCVGGLAGKEKFDYIPFGDYVFKQICDKNGEPRVKVHGLAMTGTLAARWPWYSMDSITWRYNAAVGHLAIPVLHRGKFVIERVILTDRRASEAGHYLSSPTVVQKYLDGLFESCGYTYEQLRESHQARSVVGAVLFVRMCEMIREVWRSKIEFDGWNLVLAGDPISNGQNRKVVTEVLDKKLAEQVWVLETFWTSFIGKDSPKAESLKKIYLK